MPYSLPALIDLVLAAYFWTLLAYVAGSWLFSFGIVNHMTPVAGSVFRALARLHDPILAPIRALQYRLIPNLGGFDFSPLVALLVVQFLLRPLLHGAL